MQLTIRSFIRSGRLLIKGGTHSTIYCSTRLASTVMCTAEEFRKHAVVPDVINKPPEKRIKIAFEGGSEANLGNILTPMQVKNSPKVVSWEADSDSLYTLVKTDPDAPSRSEPKFREWHHWLVVNIPGNDVNNGETLSAYVGAGPPKDTGLHRYVYLVYKQQGKISDPEHGYLPNTSGDNRGKWKVAEFAQKHQLGDPIAGNFFQAEWDEYVPELYKQLGLGT